MRPPIPKDESSRVYLRDYYAWKKFEFTTGVRTLRDILTAGTNYILMNAHLVFDPITLSILLL